MKMNKYKLGFALLKRNYKSILLFELLYKSVAMAVFAPLFVGFLNLAMKMAGMKYLSNDNIITFLLKPTTLFMVLVLFLILTLFTLIEMGAIVSCFHASYHKKKMTATDMFYLGFYSSLRMFHGKNQCLFVYVLMVLPLTNLALISSYLSSITIPEFIVDYVRQNHFLMALFIGLILMLCVFALRWLFSIHFYVNEKKNFKEARRCSLVVNKGRYVTNTIQLILWNLLIAFLFGLSGIVSIAGISYIIKVFSINKIALSLTLAVTVTVILLLLIIVANFAIPITFSFISAMYYHDKFRKGEEIPPYQPLVTKRPRFKRIVSIVLVCACLINVVYFEMISDKNFIFHVQFLDKPLVSAHRGDSVTAPENTLPAFESAIANMADYAELDVQQTKDGVIVVLHDSNLKRTTGVDKNIWEVTYEEIKALDAGSWFSKEFAGVNIPTLDEVLKLCKGKISLNIELKPTGHEVDFEKSVLEVIYENGFEEDCVVASMKYSCLEKIKEYAPEITTIFVTAVAYGSMTTMEYADGFSIEASFATSGMVNKLHEEGKLVYAWTVNKEDSIQSMIDVGVDHIITDNPVLARELIYSKSLNENIVDLINNLMK